MKVPLVSLALIAGVGFTQVNAAPYGVVMITTTSSSGIVNSQIIQSGGVDAARNPFRLGHAAGLATTDMKLASTSRIKQHGCGGSTGARAKMMQLSNKLRAALGFPMIATPAHRVGLMMPATPMMPTPHIAWRESVASPPRIMASSEGPPVAVPAHRATSRNRWMTLRHRGTFTQRLQRGLNMLGPWEGRAVSFVLGCGLGALLRMLFVFTVLLVRSYKGNRSRTGVVALPENVESGLGGSPKTEENDLPAYIDEKMAEPFVVEGAGSPPEYLAAPAEDAIKVITIEHREGEDHQLYVIWTRSDDGSVSDEDLISTPSDEFAQLYPQKLIEFYESNLKFRPESESDSIE